MDVSVCLEDIHKKLESTISEFHGTEATILYPSCFDANAGLFEALLTAEDAVISDSNNHASIIDGIRLCKVNNTKKKELAAFLSVGYSLLRFLWIYAKQANGFGLISVH